MLGGGGVTPKLWKTISAPIPDTGGVTTPWAVHLLQSRRTDFLLFMMHSVIHFRNEIRNF